MEKLFTILAMIVLLSSCATTKVFVPITKTETINVSGTKNENYVKANLWLVDIFNSAKSVIQFSDKEAGVIKGKYLLYYSSPTQYVGEITRYATITLTAIDNQISMTIDCNEHPFMFYPATRMNQDINNILIKFKSSF